MFVLPEFSLVILLEKSGFFPVVLKVTHGSMSLQYKALLQLVFLSALSVFVLYRSRALPIAIRSNPD